ncbi:hypothetical protein BpJC7_10640 [Weizmannia acidilactici]|uniref:Glycosyltransferase RgtA/B/C/D-like domain-containing protein n=1 Tax=Weizmannia acidilactici TaxID=2607726 RepID=A0A5J4JDC5_9BACI|nr:glycosyltransferase family 39 protein [Weizmannia acidilactici]GER65911.1 hypothetical protein BpJC4_03820 [Weizmannia acidilactici]GER69761.1 hypothetical protein BpJC7_10640 [Weizmannia acidilactici]GER73204.1 hypothetical protein BpPP18_12710 [Weizmannia acidilactici]
MSVKKISIGLFSIIFTAFCAFITAVSFCIPPLWAKNYYKHFVLPDGNLNISIGQASALLLFAAVAVLFYLGLYRIFSRLAEKWLKRIAAILFAAILVLEAAIIILFRGMQPPEVDGGHIYLEALYMLKHGTLAGNQYYLQLYPNNLPITVARYLLYRYVAFGNPAWFLIVDKLAAAVFLDIGIFFLWLLMVKVSNHKMGNILLVMTITWLPLFLYIPYFYTESLALAFPSMVVYLWYRYSRTWRPVYLLLLGLALAIGCQLRENMVLFIPALLIYMFYVLRPKKVLLCCAAILLTFLPATFAAKAYYGQLGYREDLSIKAPMTHWVVLGLSHEGKYNVPDTKLSESLHTQQTKKQADMALIQKRIEDRGPAGLIKLWAVKAARTFSQGDQAYANYNNHPDHYSAAYRYIYGSQKQMMYFIIQFFHAAALFLLTISGLRFFREKRYDIHLLMQICLFGSYLFFAILWEAEPRYSLLFTPYMIFGSVYGLQELHHFLEAKKLLPEPHRWKLQTAGQLAVAFCLLMMLLACAGLNAKTLTETKGKYQDYVVNQLVQKGKHFALVDAHHNAAQTFTADKPFDRITFTPVHFHGKAKYRISLSQGAGSQQKLVFERTFTNHKKPVNGHDAFLLKKELPGGNRQYTMEIRQLSGNPHARLSIYVNGAGGSFELMDVYKDGQFYQNGKPVPKTDLTFSVSKEIIGPYISRRVYDLLFASAALMLAVYCFSVLPAEESKISSKKIRKVADA